MRNWAPLAYLLLLAACQTSSDKVNTANITSTSEENREVTEYNGKISEDGAGATLAVIRQKLLDYNQRGAGGYLFNSTPSSSPRIINSNLVDVANVQQEMERSSLISYMVYESESLVVNVTSPAERLGATYASSPSLYSMSLGKSLTGYLMGHAICQGYIESLDQSLSDWPLVANTFLAEATVRDVINASMGHQVVLSRDDEERFLSGRFVNGSLRNMIRMESLESVTRGAQIHHYGQLPAFVALNYIAFKTGHNFNSFSNDVMRNHVRLSGSLIWAHQPLGREEDGIVHPNFNATREDFLRIGMTILDDWQQNDCMGQYLRNVYEGRIRKSTRQQANTGWGRARAYAGFFHTNYSGVSDTVLGMDGYGGISLLINVDEKRIVYAHSVARDYDERNLIFDMIRSGPER